METARLKVADREVAREYKTHAELWAEVSNDDAKTIAPQPARQRWSTPILSTILPALAAPLSPKAPASDIPKSRPKLRESPPAGVYWTLALALAALLIGLATRPRAHKIDATPSTSTSEAGRAQPAVAPIARVPVPIASGSAPSIPAAPIAAPEIASIDEPYFIIILDPPRHQTAFSADLENRIRDELTRGGFPNIGVSVTHWGQVYLAGSVNDPDEKDDILTLVRGVRGVREIHFSAMEKRGLYGPAYLGAETEPVGEGLGVKVTKVYDGSPAEVAGIKVGDIVTRFGVQYVIDPKSFRYMVIARVGGQRVPVTLIRDGARQTVTVRLNDSPALASR